MYNKPNENGIMKQARELGLVAACSFSEAEQKLLDSMEADMMEDPRVSAMTIAPYEDSVIEIKEEDDDSTFYKVKVEYEETDENEKTRISIFYYLAQCNSTTSAADIIRKEFVEKSACDGRIVSITEKKFDRVIL